MTRTWSVSGCDTTEARALAAELDLPPLLGRVLHARGVTKAATAREVLDPRLSSLPSPDKMAGMDAAVDRLERALRDGEGVAVFGDYDADGITAAQTIKAETHIPSIFVSAYGADEFKNRYRLPEPFWHITKPVLESDLSEAIQLVLGGQAPNSPT